MRRLVVLTVGALIASLLFAIAPASADTDYGFAGNGRYTDNAVDSMRVGVLANGNIRSVAKSGFSQLKITELLPNGAVNTAFATNGHRLVNVPGATTANFVAAIDGADFLPNGKTQLHIYMANGSTVIGRLNANATPDASFSGDGFDLLAHCGRMVHGSTSPIDGSVYSASYQAPGSAALQCEGTTIRRWTAAGAADTTWGNQAVAGAHLEAGMFPSTTAVNASGAVFVGGGTAQATMAVTKVLANGTTDASFGTAGVATFDPAPTLGYENYGTVFTTAYGYQNKMIVDIEIDNQGRVIVLGTSRKTATGSVDIVLARLTAAGALDPTFGNGGINITGSSANDYALTLKLDSAGRILVAGGQGTGPIGADGPYTQFLARFASAGWLDTGFGTGGFVTTNAGVGVGVGETMEPATIALANDSRFYIGGLRFGGVAYGGYVTAADPGPVAAVQGFNPVTPVRVMDTRTGLGGAIIGAGQTRDLVVTGTGGIPATGVKAVALNVTVVTPTAPGYLTMWPANTARPTTSVLNFGAGDIIGNGHLIGVDSATGKVKIFNAAGNSHVVVDVTGWFSSASTFNPITPARAMDTRNGTGGSATIAAGQTVNLSVTNLGGVPATGVEAVSMNVTAVTPSAPGYLTVWPAGQARPTASSLNFGAGDIVGNGIVAGVNGAGQVSIYNPAGNADVVVDVMGWYAQSNEFNSVNPTRVMDTRLGQGGVVLGPNQTRVVQLTGTGGVPASNVGAVALNVTVVTPGSAGYLTVWPTGQAMPTASSINFASGEVLGNGIVVGVDAAGRATLFNPSGNTDVVIDVTGYFPG